VWVELTLTDALSEGVAATLLLTAALFECVANSLELALGVTGALWEPDVEAEADTVAALLLLTTKLTLGELPKLALALRRAL